MQSTVEIVEKAKDVSLINLETAKIGMNMAGTSSASTDKLLQTLIEMASGAIATLCQRTFAQQTVVETFREVGNQYRLFLAQWPVRVDNDHSFLVEEDGVELVEDVDYELDLEKGRLMRLGAVWLEPVVVTYTGGYELPFQAPLALQQATILMTREAYYASIRGDASIRSISHKESRVMYFDPNAKGGQIGGGAQGGQGGSAAERAAKNLLLPFTRIEC